MDIDASRGCIQTLIYDLILFLALVLCYESIETCNEYNEGFTTIKAF